MVHATSNAGWLEVSPEALTGSGKLRLDIKENRRSESRRGEVTLTGKDFSTTVVVLQNGDRREEEEEKEEEED
jgi:hypothetical protein